MRSSQDKVQLPHPKSSTFWGHTIGFEELSLGKDLWGSGCKSANKTPQKYKKIMSLAQLSFTPLLSYVHCSILSLSFLSLFSPSFHPSLLISLHHLTTCPPQPAHPWHLPLLHYSCCLLQLSLFFVLFFSIPFNK